MVTEVILEHRNTGEGKKITVGADWSFAEIYWFVREQFPEWCFVASR